MGNDHSIEKSERLARETHTTQALLEKQRKFYEEKCKILIQQAQSSQQPNVIIVEQANVGNSSGQPMNTLYPNLHMAAASQPCSSTNNNLAATHQLQHASTSGNNNITPRSIEPTSSNSSNWEFGPNMTAMATPSAPPEPSPHAQRGKMRKGPQPKKNLNVGKEFSCETCGEKLGLNIYQCMNGHSSCHDCRVSGRKCGGPNCGNRITDVRNRSVEALVAEIKVSEPHPTETKPKLAQTNCPNQHHGCKLHFSKMDMPNHLQECLFNEIACPLASAFGLCPWRGKINRLASHFMDCHPVHRQANVDTELTILDIKNPSRVLHLVGIGPFNFLVNIKVDTAMQTVYMVVQFFGTSFGAAKWKYEFHIYNKSQPRKKYLYSDICQSHCISTEEIFDKNTCAVLPASYCKTFVNNSGSINYKFYIKKLVE